MDKLALSEVIGELRAELMRAKDAGDDQAAQDPDTLRFEVIEAEVELEVVATRTDTDSAGVKFWVVNAGVGAEDTEGTRQRLRVRLSALREDDKPYRVSRSDTR